MPIRIIDEFVNHQVAVRTDSENCVIRQFRNQMSIATCYDFCAVFESNFARFYSCQLAPIFSDEIDVSTRFHLSESDTGRLWFKLCWRRYRTRDGDRAIDLGRLNRARAGTKRCAEWTIRTGAYNAKHLIFIRTSMSDASTIYLPVWCRGPCVDCFRSCAALEPHQKTPMRSPTRIFLLITAPYK